MPICDWCDIPTTLSDLFNVDYLDADGNETGWANVLCGHCVEVSKQEMGEQAVSVWK